MPCFGLPPAVEDVVDVAMARTHYELYKELRRQAFLVGGITSITGDDPSDYAILLYPGGLNLYCPFIKTLKSVLSILGQPLLGLLGSIISNDLVKYNDPMQRMEDVCNMYNKYIVNRGGRLDAVFYDHVIQGSCVISKLGIIGVHKDHDKEKLDELLKEIGYHETNSVRINMGDEVTYYVTTRLKLGNRELGYRLKRVSERATFTHYYGFTIVPGIDYAGTVPKLVY